jgi:circadian clock protein KaiB
MLRLHLYIAGSGLNSTAAVANLKRVLARFPDRAVELAIIDVLANPEAGVMAGVIVTPMLLKLAPQPERRLLGNLKDEVLLLAALGLGEGPG